MRSKNLTSAVMVMIAVTGSAYAAPVATKDGVPFVPSGVYMSDDSKLTITRGYDNQFNGVVLLDNADITLSNSSYNQLKGRLSDNSKIEITDKSDRNQIESTLSGDAKIIFTDTDEFKLKGTLSDNAKVIIKDAGYSTINDIDLKGNAILDVRRSVGSLKAIPYMESIRANSGTIEFNSWGYPHLVSTMIINDSDGAKVLYAEGFDTVGSNPSKITTVLDRAAGSQLIYDGFFTVGSKIGLTTKIEGATNSFLKIKDIAISDTGDFGLDRGEIIGVDHYVPNEIKLYSSNATANVENVRFKGEDNTFILAGIGDNYEISNVDVNGISNEITTSNVRDTSIIGSHNELYYVTSNGSVINGEHNHLRYSTVEKSILNGDFNNLENGSLDNSRVDGNRNILAGDNSAIIVSGNDNILKDLEYSHVLGNENEIRGRNILAIGNNIKKTIGHSVFLGNETAYNDNAQQSAGTSTTNKSSTIGNMTFNNTAGVDTNVGVVSIGNENQTRVIQGVSAGLVSKDSTDAINGSQLYATNAAVSNLDSSIDTINSLISNMDSSITNIGSSMTNIAASMTNIIGGNTHMDSTGNITVSNVGGTGRDTVDDAIRSNKERIDALESVNTNTREETKSVGALSAALAGLHPMQYDPKKPSQIMAAVGHYDSKKAFALGLAHYVNEDLMFTTGLALQGSSHNKNMVNLGVTYKFGKGRDDVRKEYVTGPISSIYVMQDKIDALEQKNQQLEEANAHFMERTRELEEKVNALLAKVS